MKYCLFCVSLVFLVETALVPLPGVSFDQLFLHLIEGTAQVSHKCQYYKYDVDILRGGRHS